MTGNFCPEDPETRIAEGLRACGHIEPSVGAEVLPQCTEQHVTLG